MAKRKSVPRRRRRDVTQIMSRYRECVRHLWNTYFWDEAYRKTWCTFGAPYEEHWDKLDRFEDICGSLFTELVLEKIGEPSNSPTELEKRRSWLRIVPDRGETSILINREKADSGCHNYAADKIDRNADLRFIEFYDWDQIGFMELQYYRVRIAAFPEHPELIGRDALIECRSYNCKVVVE